MTDPLVSTIDNRCQFSLLAKCRYERSDQEDLLNAFIARLLSTPPNLDSVAVGGAYVPLFLQEVAGFIKNVRFKEEEEWRTVSGNRNHRSQKTDDRTPQSYRMENLETPWH